MTFLWSSYKALPQRGFAACCSRIPEVQHANSLPSITIDVQLSEQSAGRRDLGQCP
jgi:hypothetical protein